MCEYNNCKLCPRECGVDRAKTVGACKATDKVKVALASVHQYEEPCISILPEF